MWWCCGSPVCGQAAEKEAELLRYKQDDAALDALLAQEATEEEEEAAAAEDAEPPTKRRCICCIFRVAQSTHMNSQ